MERPHGVRVLSLAICFLLWPCFLVSTESRGILPTDHGLASEKNPALVTPAMAAFFQGSSASSSSSDVEMPEARNVTDPIWSLAADATRGSASSGAESRERVKTPVLLTVGIVGAVAGVGLLVAAAFAYVVRSRRTRRSKYSATERTTNVGPAPFNMYALEPV